MERLERIHEFITWIFIEHSLPPKSDSYLVYTNNGNITTLSYTSKHKLFNCQDYDNEIEAKKTAIEVLYWAFLPTGVEREIYE